MTETQCVVGEQAKLPFRPDTLISYKGGGYDGCFWEWNYCLIQNKKFIDQSTSHDHLFIHQKKDGTTFPVQISACGFIWKNRKIFCAIVKDRTGTSSVK